MFAGANLADMASALFAYTGTTTLSGAKNVMEGWGTIDIHNRAPLLWLLQQLVP